MFVDACQHVGALVVSERFAPFFFGLLPNVLR
jgi:hypothetical protein